MKRRIFMCLRICGYLIGLGILFYPAISNYLNQRHATTIATDYEQEVSHISQQQEDEMMQKALAYNRTLIGNSEILDPFSEEAKQLKHTTYDKVLNIDGNGMLGYIEIPKIKILLPIYHGISERVLQSGIGHLPETSFPIGGETSHAVLSGHRGLPSAKLFTDLDKMEKGDVFYIKVLHHTFAYQVDQILTVKPTQTEALSIVEGKDYVTLLTCTPYAINTHRLLVRGVRIPYEKATEIASEMELKAELPLYIKALAVGAVVLVGVYLIVKWRVHRKGNAYDGKTKNRK